MADRRSVGPKGQVVIPEKIRRTLGMKPGSTVRFEARDGEVIIKPEISPEEYVEYFSKTFAKKLRRQIDVKKLIEEEVAERVALSR